jgi:hypothetical protein
MDSLSNISVNKLAVGRNAVVLAFACCVCSLLNVMDTLCVLLLVDLTNNFGLLSKLWICDVGF